jgi:hypothetical protein
MIMNIAPKKPPHHAHHGIREMTPIDGMGSRNAAASATIEMTPKK